MGTVRDRPDAESSESMTSRLPPYSAFNDMPIEKLRDAELASEPFYETYAESTDDAIGTFCHAAEKQLYTLVDWAKRIPFFTDLPIDDQVTLLRSGKSKSDFVHWFHSYLHIRKYDDQGSIENFQLENREWKPEVMGEKASGFV
jgi:Ligand-binding domain of nuclear hormone receptor